MNITSCKLHVKDTQIPKNLQDQNGERIEKQA